ALTEQRITTEFGFAIATTDSADVVRTYFTDQRKTAGAEYAINEVYCAHRCLPELLALITLDVVTSRPRPTSMCVISRCYKLRQSGTTHITTINLNWHVGSIAQLTRY